MSLRPSRLWWTRSARPRRKRKSHRSDRGLGILSDPFSRSEGISMTDLASLERQILDAVAASSDEAALDAVRVSALGKKGSVSELLKTLGGMSPEERKVQGAAFNALRDRVGEAIAARKSALEASLLDSRLASERVDVSLPVDRP